MSSSAIKKIDRKIEKLRLQRDIYVLQEELYQQKDAYMAMVNNRNEWMIKCGGVDRRLRDLISDLRAILSNPALGRGVNPDMTRTALEDIYDKVVHADSSS